MKLSSIKHHQNISRSNDDTFYVNFELNLFANKFNSYEQATDFVDELYTFVNNFVQYSEKNLKEGE